MNGGLQQFARVLTKVTAMPKPSTHRYQVMYTCPCCSPRYGPNASSIVLAIDAWYEEVCAANNWPSDWSDGFACDDHKAIFQAATQLAAAAANKQPTSGHQRLGNIPFNLFQPDAQLHLISVPTH
jgi:hypothetical protein